MTLKKGRVSRRRKYWYDQSPFEDLSKSTDTDSNEKQKNEDEGTHSGKDQEAELQSLVLPQRDTIEDDHNCSVFNRRNDDLKSSDCQENTSQPATSVFNIFNEDYKIAVNELVKSKFDTVYAVNRNSEKCRYLNYIHLRELSNTTQEPNFLSTGYKHSSMTKDQLIGKINQQISRIVSLQHEVLKIRRKFDNELRNRGVDIDELQSLELKDTMTACTQEMEKAFPNSNSFQRLFWMQQFKSLSVKSNKGMRWHPMILRWCLYLRQKSNAAYESLRDSGFITLPSSRTLFDYSHYTKSANGFQAEVIDILQQEAAKRDMYSEKEPWRNYVGILFEEIKIKADLVYDKHSGELICYCNLDKVGNQIMDFEKQNKGNKEAEIAKYMLVVMVRGVVGDLKFPLAGFSTPSITADFLYPIIWKSIRILETGKAKLKVLFITCDGASANRRFFKLHGSGSDFIHYTPNPFSDDGRNVFFIPGPTSSLLEVCQCSLWYSIVSAVVICCQDLLYLIQTHLIC